MQWHCGKVTIARRRQGGRPRQTTRRARREPGICRPSRTHRRTDRRGRCRRRRRVASAPAPSRLPLRTGTTTALPSPRPIPEGCEDHVPCCPTTHPNQLTVLDAIRRGSPQAGTPSTYVLAPVGQPGVMKQILVRTLSFANTPNWCNSNGAVALEAGGGEQSEWVRATRIPLARKQGAEHLTGTTRESLVYPSADAKAARVPSRCSCLRTHDLAAWSEPRICGTRAKGGTEAHAGA